MFDGYPIPVELVKFYPALPDNNQPDQYGNKPPTESRPDMTSGRLVGQLALY